MTNRTVILRPEVPLLLAEISLWKLPRSERLRQDCGLG